jgi:hypothetical protein
MQNQVNRPSATSGGFVVGLLLVLTGVFFLVARYLPSDVGQYGWPLFVVMAGVVLLVIGMTGRSVSGFVVPGSIVTVVGSILAVQSAFGLFATWSYAWALAFPGAVGLGIAIQGMMVGNGDQVRTGTRMMATGAVLFAIFGAIFEGLLHVSGYDFGTVGDLLIALMLIASGVVLIIVRIASGRSGATPPTPLPGA